jgi:hypothetical protein
MIGIMVEKVKQIKNQQILIVFPLQLIFNLLVLQILYLILQLLTVEEAETLFEEELFEPQPQPQLFSGLYFPKDSPGPVPVTDDATIILLQKKVGIHARTNILLFLFMHN